MSDQQELHPITTVMGDPENLTCGVCRFWCGRCLKGHINRTASDEACEKFEKRSWIK